MFDKRDFSVLLKSLDLLIAQIERRIRGESILDVKYVLENELKFILATRLKLIEEIK